MTKRQRLRRDPSNQPHHKKRAWFKRRSARFDNRRQESQRKSDKLAAAYAARTGLKATP